MYVPHPEKRSVVEEMVRRRLEGKIPSIKGLGRKQSSKYSTPHPEDENEQQHFMQVGQLTAGRSFGELALISNKPRAATIRCSEPTHFATLDKNAYEKVFAKLEEMAINEKISFLKGLEVFHNWSRSAVSKLTYFL